MSIRSLRLAALSLALTANCPAQNLSIDWYTHAGGGGHSTGSNLDLTVTIGQIGSSQSAGQTLTLDSGFWGFLNQGFPAGSITAFDALPGPGRVTLSWTSQLADHRLRTFTLTERVAGSAGMFGNPQNLPYTGPGEYERQLALVPGVTMEYEISEIYDGIATILPRARTTGASYSGLPAPGVLWVRPFSSLPTIGGALSVATGPSVVILVAPGTYPSFTIGPNAPASIKISSTGPGPLIIDTSSGPITIQGQTANRVIQLEDLVVGSAGSSNAALRIQNSHGMVILDSCELHGGVNQPGLELDDAIHVAIQRCVMTGTPGLLVGNGSVAAAGRGSVDAWTVEGQSNLTVCQLVPGSSSVEPSSNLTTISGVMPDLDFPTFSPLGYDLEMDVETFEDGPFAAFVAPFHEWTSIPFIDMPALLPLSLLLPLGNGVGDFSGRSQISLRLPLDTTLRGIPYAAQLLGIEPATATLRFSNAQTLVIM